MKKVLRFVLPLVVLVGGVMIARYLISTAPEAERAEEPDRGALVRVEAVHRTPQRIDIEAQGEVVASREAILTSQVAGRIEWQHPNLVQGGLLSQGEEVVRIERQEYRYMVDQAEASLDEARAMVEVEEGRQTIASREYDLFRGEVAMDEEQRSLVLREPQERQARARVDAAESQLGMARLALRRASIEAPFNAYVRAEQVEEGQAVGPQTPIATLVGTDTFWVRVSLPVDQLARIRVPGANATEGSAAVITQDLGNHSVSWEGRVIRLLPDLDPVGRMARLLVEIADPLHLTGNREEAADTHDALPLLVGSFVQVVFEGHDVVDLIEVPRAWVHEGDRVFVMSEDGTLDIRHADVVWGRRDSVLVSDGLEDGDRVVRSHIGVPVQGMALRLTEEPVGGEGTGSSAPAPEVSASESPQAPIADDDSHRSHRSE